MATDEKVKPKDIEETKEELRTKWLDRIKAAVKFRDRIIDKKDFKTYRNYYCGRFNEKRSTSTRVDVNMVFSTTTLMASALASRDPWIACEPREKEYESKAPLCEKALNNTLKDIGYRLTLQDIIKYASIYGYGIGKAGYIFDAENKTEKNVARPQYNFFVKKDTVYFNIVNSQNLLLDPTAKMGIKDSTFLAEILIQRKDIIEKRYGINLSTVRTVVPEWLGSAKDDMKDTKAFEMVVLYEVWDVIEHKRYIIIEGYEQEIFTYAWPYGLDGYPYSILIFNRVPEEPYGISDVSLYKTQQDELNMVRSTEAEHVKKNNCKYTAHMEKITETEVNKIQANETGTIAQVTGDNAIMPIPPFAMPADFANYEGRIMSDIQETLGMADIMMASGPGKKNKKTATQANEEAYFGRLRIGDRQQSVNEFVLDSCEIIFKIMQNEYDVPRNIKLIGPEGKYISKEFNKQNLEGEYDLIVQQSTGSKAVLQNVQMIEEGLKLITGNPIIDPNIYTDIIIDTFFDGVDTTKLKVPNAEEIFKDPIKREQWRQDMIAVATQNSLRLMSQTIQGAGQQQKQPKQPPMQKMGSA